jgi:hypothetical protein
MKDQSFLVRTLDLDVGILLAEFTSLTNEDIVLLEYDSDPTIPSMGWLYNKGITNTIGKATDVSFDN